MNVRVIAAAIGIAGAALVWSWWNHTPERQAARVEARIAALKQLVSEESAALVRHRADCQADGIELPAAAAVCWRAFDASAAISDRTVRGLTDEIGRLESAR